MVNKWINNILVMVYMDLFLRQTAVNTRNGIPDLCVNGFIRTGENFRAQQEDLKAVSGGDSIGPGLVVLHTTGHVYKRGEKSPRG